MGGEHDKKLQHERGWYGPVKNRSCTDWSCLIIFLAFMGGWAGIGYYAYSYGDVATLLAPTDSEGRKCGFHQDVEGKKYLVFFDLTKCSNTAGGGYGCHTPQVCVESCPTDNFLWLLNATISVIANNITALRGSMICKNEVDVSSATLEQLNTYVANDVCANWYLRSTSWAGRCLPNGVPDILINYTLTAEELSDATEYIKLFLQLEEIITNVYDDFIATRWTLVVILVCSAVVSLIYILLMRWIAAPIVLVTILGICGLLGYTAYRFYRLYASGNSAMWLVFGIICLVLLVIVVLVCIFLRKRILLACQLIGEASKAVLNTTSSLLFPILPWVLQMAVITYTLVIGICLLTLRVQTYTVQLGGDCECPEDLGYVNGTTCSPDLFYSECRENNSDCITGGCYLSSSHSPWFAGYMHAFNIIGFLWLIWFTTAFESMILAGTFATWYWTLNKSDVPFFTLIISFWRTIRYHLGTLAFGSFVITICNLIRWLLEYADGKLKRGNNRFAKFLLICLKCCFKLLGSFIKFITEDAYIMCSIHGKGFCVSARDAFNLVMRNVVRVAVLDKITEWLLCMGKILVTGCVAWGSWLYIKDAFPAINYMLVPVILVIIGAYLVATVFFSVYSMAVETIFHCFLEDTELNDGTPDKPYYMSKDLMKILQKS